MTQASPIRTARISVILLVGLFFGLTTRSLSIAQKPNSAFDDGLTQPASWKLATSKQVQATLENWLIETGGTAENVKRLRDFLRNDSRIANPGGTLDGVIDCIVIFRPDVNQLCKKLSRVRSAARAPAFRSFFDNSNETEFVLDHVRLFFARWLTQNEFYDEALSHFEKLELTRVLDPATLLFYRGLVEHQLLEKSDCLVTVNKLLENASQLPRRYDVLSRLMLADIQPVETDSLDEISRIMNDVRRRTGLFRSGKAVLAKEEAVINKLDKLIEKLESQQQSQQAADNTAPSAPMQDSFKTGGKGDGRITHKNQSEGGDWGDLPPAERAAAMAEMAKEMPPHYRAVIEAYFRRLARESDR